MKLQLLSAGAALVLGACASSDPEPLTISSVRVDTDLTAIQSPQAVAYWKSLSDDLETAIAAEFAGHIDPSGHPVTVDIDELSLIDTYAAGASIDKARLSGLVTLGDIEPDGLEDPSYTVTATAQDVVPFLTAEGDRAVSATSAAYYDAIVRAFARGAAKSLRSGS